MVATGGLSSGVVDHITSGGDVVRASGADYVKGCAHGGMTDAGGSGRLGRDRRGRCVGGPSSGHCVKFGNRGVPALVSERATVAGLSLWGPPAEAGRHVHRHSAEVGVVAVAFTSVE